MSDCISAEREIGCFQQDSSLNPLDVVRNLSVERFSEQLGDMLIICVSENLFRVIQNVVVLHTFYTSSTTFPNNKIL